MVMVVCGGGLGEEEREEEEGRKEEEDEIGDVRTYRMQTLSIKPQLIGCSGVGFHLGTGLLSFYYVQQGSIDLTGFGFGPVSESEETHSLGSQHHSNGLESTLNRPSKWIVSGIFAAVLLGRHDAEAVWFAMAICCIKTIEQETLSKESKGSISLKSFLLSFFDFQSRPGRKGVTDLIKALLRVFTVLWVREVWKREKNNNNNKKKTKTTKKNPLICLSVSLRDEMGFSRRRVSCASSAALKSPLSSYHQREFLMLSGTLQWMKFSNTIFNNNADHQLISKINNSILNH
ncbi:hypothetical protein G4B88_002037 [Cannabis sativa]|uniref:Uncharacterized protein n=1 Tax=Cannabis sativa TaxID=3483 RepID=A0A7J6HD83_CANSA|nr:hypothetical protein G4B88_002037 [Cannabis sativa]